MHAATARQRRERHAMLTRMLAAAADAPGQLNIPRSSVIYETIPNQIVLYTVYTRQDTVQAQKGIMPSGNNTVEITIKLRIDPTQNG